MKSDAENRLEQRNIIIEEFVLGRSDEPDITGYVIINEEDEGGLRLRTFVALGTNDEDRQGYAEWLELALARVVEHGPDPDGWQRRESDGGWQKWTRKVWLPDL